MFALFIILYISFIELSWLFIVVLQLGLLVAYCSELFDLQESTPHSIIVSMYIFFIVHYSV